MKFPTQLQALWISSRYTKATATTAATVAATSDQAGVSEHRRDLLTSREKAQQCCDGDVTAIYRSDTNSSDTNRIVMVYLSLSVYC